MKKFSLLIGWLLYACICQAASLKVFHLTCEHIQNPLGIDQQQPLLSWKLESDERNQYQSAYEILVSTDQEKLEKGKADVWNSGRIKSDETLLIPYAGKKLKSFTRYYWKVRVYNQQGEASDWSETAWWETAMLKADDWKASWIYDGSEAPSDPNDFYKDNPAPLFRKTFQTKEGIQSARLYIAGIGYYEASLNGQRIGDRRLDPGWTNYDKEILYSTYDITEMLQTGKNCLGVVLGNGFYNPIPMPIFKNLREYLTIGQPCLKAQLLITYKNGKQEWIYSDSSWTFADSPILRNNVYLGEKYDARKEIKDWDKPTFNASSWKQAIPVPTPPQGKLTAQMQPPIRIREIIRPTRMTETRQGEFVFDLGQNMAGVARIKVKGPKGTRITIRYGEDVYSDGSLNVMTSVAGQHKTVWNAKQESAGAPPTAWQEDTYILKGEGEEIWMPQFTFHGFRYIEVTGWLGRPTLDNIEGIRLSADLKVTGEFSSSNELLNRLHRVLDYTFLSNVFSVESDCPAREKFGYGGDIVGVSRTFCYFYDMHNFYAKAIRDFANDQRPLGGFTETAPYNGIADQGLGDGSGPIGWQLAFAFLQKQLYEYYGDKRIIENYYPQLKKQVDFLASKAKDYMIDRCINDHESLDQRIPALFATAHFYHHVLLITEFAQLTNRKADQQQYESLAQQIKAAFIQKFVQTDTGKIGNGTPAEQAFGLYYGLIPEDIKTKVIQQLVQAISNRNNHITSGIFGTPIVLTVLSDLNLNDIAYQMATQIDFPGWGHMLSSGATTLWETWKYSDNVFSHNHPMFGSVGEWMYQSLAGIKALSPGFKQICIHPQASGDLQWVNSSYESSRGKITCQWKKENGIYMLQVHIPVNTKAQVFIPNKSQLIKESGKSIASSSLIQIIREESDHCWLEIPSGSYQFSCPIPQKD